MGETVRKRKRVESVSAAAQFVGVSRQRLQEMQRESPWWVDDLKTAEGFDVGGIIEAQLKWHHAEEIERIRKESPKTQYDERMLQAALEEAEESAAVRRLDRQKRERLEMQASNQLVLVTIVQSLWREALGELRRALDDVPFVFSQMVPPDLQSHCFTVDVQHAKQVSDLAPLQRVMIKRIENYERWWDQFPADLFEQSSDALAVDEALATDSDMSELEQLATGESDAVRNLF